MNEFSDTEIWIATAFAFAVGYVLVSFIARLMKTEPPQTQPTFAEPTITSVEQPRQLSDEDHKFAQVLGVHPQASADELEQAYQASLAKNHPNNVAHLDMEFRQVAERRTREIEEAYEYLKNRRSR